MSLMTFNEDTDEYTLSTGRTFYANNGVLGLGADEKAPIDGLSEGYDGGIDLVCEWDDEFVPWTAEERAEVADAMIRSWEAFKVGTPAPAVATPIK